MKFEHLPKLADDLLLRRAGYRSVQDTPLDQLGNSYIEVLRKLSDLMAISSPPHIRFSKAGVTLREEATKLYETFLSLRATEDERAVRYNVTVNDLHKAVKRLVTSAVEMNDDEINPLVLLFSSNVCRELLERMQSITASVDQPERKIRFTHPPEVLDSLAEGQGMISIALRTFKTETGTIKFKMSINEVWDTKTRKNPIVSALFREFPGLLKNPIIHGHYHDDDRFQFLFDLNDQDPTLIVKILASLAKESWKSRPGHGDSKRFKDVGPHPFLEELRASNPDLQLCFSTRW